MGPSSVLFHLFKVVKLVIAYIATKCLSPVHPKEVEQNSRYEQ